MNEDWPERGYSHDLALRKLLELYASSKEYRSDLHSLGMELLPYRPSLKKMKRKDGLIPRLIKNKDSYTLLTKEWRCDWRNLIKRLPSTLRGEIETVAEKWGLKCTWGCGLITGIQSPRFYMTNFIVVPGPPQSRTYLKTEIDINDTRESIKHKAKDLERKASGFLERTRKNLNTLDYRGFESHKKKDIATQVQWLFWHITPPYLNSLEIATKLQESSGDFVDRFYVQRCYQNMAKLLGIRLTKGWPKGRKRDQQQDGRVETYETIIDQ
jgi:hypothetical protein